MIGKFRGEHFFLSNMKPLENWIETEQGVLVPTAEHAYQAAKFEDPTVHLEIAQARATENTDKAHADGVASKDLAHNLIEAGVEVRTDWETAKLGVMFVCVRQKFFKNEDLAARLVATGTEELVEGNLWGDVYWGVSPIGSNTGENHLGRILMRVREQLIEGGETDESE